MAITHKWYVENQVLLVHFEGELILEDLMSLAATLEEAFQTATRKNIAHVHVILDESGMTDPPKKVWEIVKIGRVLTYEKMGWMLIYGPDNPFTRFMAQMVTGIIGIKFRRMPDLEAALTHLKAADLSIDWEKVRS